MIRSDENQLRTVRLYGPLGARFGRVHRLAVQSAAEAVRALCVLLPGFERELMTAHDRNVGFGVFVGTRNLGRDELGVPARDDDIRIAPFIRGAKRQGITQIIIGVIIIAAVTYFSAGTLTAQTIAATATAGGVTGAVFGIGVAMVLGGVAQALTPTPRGLGTADSANNGASYRFNGPVNTTAQGNPVPLLYGEMIVGSATISAAIVAEDQQ